MWALPWQDVCRWQVRTPDRTSGAAGVIVFVPTERRKARVLGLGSGCGWQKFIEAALGNTDNAIGGLSIGATYSQAEVQALRDKCEELADDVRALSTLLHAIRTGLVSAGLIKGGA